MMNKSDFKKDVARFLAQKKEQGDILWASPSDIEPVEEVHAEPQAEKIHEKPAPKTSKPSEEKVVTQPSGLDRGAPEPEPIIPQSDKLEDPFPLYENLEDFYSAIHNCKKCPLGDTRNNIVMGAGDPNADLILVGEAPGAEEDKRGEPFVGRAGKLLDQILAAVDLERGKNVYIANILKCRPPNNRDPLGSEVQECEPHLVKQLQLIKPKLIVALGRISAQTLLRTSDSLAKMRGKLHNYHGVPLLVTYHPAALLRNPQWKRPTWEDVQEMKRILDGDSNL